MSAPVVITSRLQITILNCAQALKGTRADNYYPSNTLCDTSAQALAARENFQRRTRGLTADRKDFLLIVLQMELAGSPRVVTREGRRTCER